MKYIRRDTYMQRLEGLKKTSDIKIITGMRRSGKSELMRAFMKELKEQEPEANQIFIDFMDLKYDSLKNYKELYEYVEANYQEEKTNYLFIDEVQMCEKFELAVNSFQNSGRYDIFITGSNAFLLSSDLATLFTGRYIEIQVFPFSFAEYCQYYQNAGSDAERFDRYVVVGGLAGSYEYAREVDRKAYIHDVYSTIVTRDLVQKFHLSDTVVLDHLSRYLMDNISNLTSVNKISLALTADKTPTNHVSVGRYIQYLCQAYMFYEVNRYDIKGRKYLQTISKYYLADLSFRYELLGTRNMDYGRAYENLVLLELKRRGYETYVGKLYQTEVDFVAISSSRKFYIQVSDNISAPETLERELRPLQKIRDAYPKVLIARTSHEMYDRDGILIMDLERWLLGKETLL